MLFVLENQDIHGPVNFCAPNPVKNRDLAKAMGRVLNRPSFMPAPGFMIRIALGEFGNTLLSSQRAIPEKLISFGFYFKYPDIVNAIGDIVNQWNP
jgi:NAD dependent epimerase/dehydratase family enzyme